MHSKVRFAHKVMARQEGLSLTELTLAVSVLVMLAVIALPSVIQKIHDARVRATVQQLMGDVVWLRKTASTRPDGQGGSLTIHADCSWSVSVGGAVDTAHSMNTASLGQIAPGLRCTSSALTPLPLTLSFTRQGAIVPSPLLTYSAADGQRWSLQVMASGSVLFISESSG